jgi:hypothetical protein
MDADPTIPFDVSSPHLGAALDPLFAKLDVQFVGRDHLLAHVPQEHFAVLDQQERRWACQPLECGKSECNPVDGAISEVEGQG